MDEAVTADSVLPHDPASAGLRPSQLSFLVVGLGASAGGMQALTNFFERMPPDNGMAFVVVLHLSPQHDSHAASILQRATAMPVQQVSGTVAIECEHVYIVPPGKALGMDDGALHLVDMARVNGRNVAIDHFFRILAEVHGPRAVSIVLSGTGTDGSVGLMRIKERGGLTLAQAPADAEHKGMPSAALTTGMVDFVLPVAEMPAKLVQLAANASRIRLPSDAPLALDSTPPGSPEEAEAAEAALAAIMNILRTRTQRDFRHYKRPTVLRRLERRMQVTAVPNLPAYRDYLQANVEETPALLQDMLISVTNFFRDRDAFDALEHAVLPDLQGAMAAEHGLRAWVVGCASGEEAYSLAMLLQDLRARTSEAPNFQIFASDIDERALAQARAALYPGSIVTDVPPARLRTFFTREQDHYRVVKSLRERVLFASHNVLRDPPFSRVDLICCRNLLIYLDRSAQAAALDIFRFALKPGGVLFLGSSESTDVVGDSFSAIDKKHRIYRVNASAPLRLAELALDLKRAAPASLREVSQAGARAEPFADVHLRALDVHGPASVLIDTDYNILHMSGGVSRYLQVQGGLPTHRLLDNVHPALRLDLRTALFQARASALSHVAPPCSVDSQWQDTRVKITVQPLRDLPDSPPLLLVLFTELAAAVAAGAPRTPGTPGADNGALLHLEEENKRLLQRLQEVIERSETSTEELMSSNEELQAVNEELRSATEELETSGEELQSTNEELITVNSQLAMKVDETSRINDDLQNLINSNDIATVFVDREMRIKRYTPQATALFNLIPPDVGRSLLHITHRLQYDTLVDDAHAAFQTLRLVEREVQCSAGRHYVARMLPYRTGEDKIEGAILSFVDVTMLRQSQHEARAGQERLRDAVESTRDFAILTVDSGGLINSWNPGAERMFGYTEAEIVGRPFADIFTDEDRAADVPGHELEQARQTGRAEDERWHRRKDGSVFYCSGVTTRLEDGRGFAKIARDLTGSKQSSTARELLLSNEQAGRRDAEAMMEAKEIFLAVMSHELKHPLNLIHVNAEVLARLPEVKSVPVAARAAAIIRQTVAGQAKIIDDLLDLSRARTGKLSLDRSLVAWGETVRRIVEALRADAESKNVALHFEPAGSAVAELHSLFDPVRAEQVVWNLLSNALKFTPKGGSVRVALAAEDGDARLTVTDTGRGIDRDFINRVFDMFSQEPGPRRRGEEGMGIGLALVRELVQAHGGRVQVRSGGIGHGAEFSVWVPLHRDAPAPRADERRPSVLHGMQVLVVDDSADSAQSFALLLGLTGAEVTAVTSGAEALARMQQTRFDLLVSDISMPGMSGLELIAALRKRPDHARTIALACSGYGRAQDERSAIEAGFDALVPKPAALEQIERVVAALVAARAPADG